MTHKQFNDVLPDMLVLCNSSSFGNCYSKGTIYKVIETDTYSRSIRSIDSEGDMNGYHYSKFDIIPILKKAKP